MDAIICNAGKGSRLGALGIQRRKCLFRDPHADKSILWYQLDALHEIGIQRVVIVSPEGDTQIKAEVIRLHDRHPGMEIVCVPIASHYILESIQAGVQYTHADNIVRLDGDVCPLNRSDLDALQSFPGNALCCYKVVPGLFDNATPDFRYNETGRISFWDEGDESCWAWSCMDVWRKSDLIRILDHSSGEDGTYFFKQVNWIQDSDPDLEIEMVEIPPVYEIDTPADIDRLMRQWDRLAEKLEEDSLQYWKGIEAYPAFTIDKEALWIIDAELVLEFLKEGYSLLELGAGTGRLAQLLLERGTPSRYDIVEPNPNWAHSISESFSRNFRVQVFPQTVSEYNALHTGEVADLAIAFGWATYLIHDDSLHRSLAGLPAKRLLLKAPEPPQERFSRLRVDHFSKELGTHYISLYRSASETCRLVRNAGWIVTELRRSIYPEPMESAYGSRTFLIVAERP